MAKKDKGEMIATPSMNFKSVDELVKTDILSLQEKLTALYNWKQTCELQKASTNEGMSGERTTPYTEILAAIRKLENKKE